MKASCISLASRDFYNYFSSLSDQHLNVSVTPISPSYRETGFTSCEFDFCTGVTGAPTARQEFIRFTPIRMESCGVNWFCAKTARFVGSPGDPTNLALSDRDQNLFFLVHYSLTLWRVL